MVVMHKSLRFESFTLDLERLRLDGAVGHADLRRKSFDVLRYLIEHAGLVVTKEELIKGVWPDVTVSDESLTQCISEVRRALGEAGHRIIKTVPRRGYLFDVPIDASEVTAVGSRDAQQHTAAATAEPATSGLALPDRPSIAVLPFANMSGDPGQEYIADGIVEDITTELSRFRDLFVIARNSSFRYKGQAVDVRQVGRELGVRYVLEGSIRRDHDRLRISAQLIDAVTGAHRWAERYDRDVKDVFAVQDEVACTVAAILAAHVSKAEAERTLLKPPTSLQAYDYYMRAAETYTGFHRLMQVAAIYETRRLLGQCLAIDPGYARAHALYSATRTSTWALALDGDHLTPAALEKALQSAENAVQLDANLPQAHAQLGYVLCFRTMPDAAVAQFERALALNPNFTDWRYAAVLAFAGQAERAIDAAKAHLRVDPFALPIARGHLGLIPLSQKIFGSGGASPSIVCAVPTITARSTWLAATYAHLGDSTKRGPRSTSSVARSRSCNAKRTRQLETSMRLEGAAHVADGLRRRDCRCDSR